MDLLEFNYTIRSCFTPPVTRHAFKLRVLPWLGERTDAFQSIVRQKVRVMPDCHLLHATDAFGNSVLYGSLSSPHEVFTVESKGLVACCEYAMPEVSPHDIFLFPTPLTQWNDDIRRMAAGRDADGIMHAVHECLCYERFVTDNTTTAIEAYRLHRGVCQDYAHLMIAACRSQCMHARYVNGLTMGDGETHAWVEVWTDGMWRGYDPTYDTCVEHGYLKFAQGRDVNDCPTNRGRFYGWTSEMLTVKANLSNNAEMSSAKANLNNNAEMSSV